MSRPNRNDLCPCGSGKKYKKCCLAQAQTPPPSEAEASSVRAALAHLHNRHRKALDAAMDSYFDCIEDFEFTGVSPESGQMLEINLFEWVLADAEIEVGGEWRLVYEVLTSPGGPLLTVEERAALRELAERPLRLYEVVSTDPGSLLVVLDVAVPDAEPVTVRERTASRTLQPGDIIGLRLVRRQRDDEWIMSGASYPLPRILMQSLREEILETEASGIDEVDFAISDLIVGSWLRQLDSRLPELVDAGTGEPILLTTDHYAVLERSSLLQVLTAQADLEGDVEEGWARLERETQRVLCEISVDGDRLEVFTRTRRRADESRAWLEEIASNALKFRIREHADPRSSAVLAGRAAGSGEDGSGVGPTLPPDAYEQIYHRIYADWADEPIPALEGATPREAISTPLGEQRVVELLLSYEHSERRKATDEGREPVSFEFLWAQLGIERP